jgi:hypothetical protein
MSHNPIGLHGLLQGYLYQYTCIEIAKYISGGTIWLKCSSDEFLNIYLLKWGHILFCTGPFSCSPP